MNTINLILFIIAIAGFGAMWYFILKPDFSNALTSNAEITTVSYCCLCSTQIKKHNLVDTWQDSTVGFDYLVHSNCATDEKLTTEFNRIVATNFYGD